MKEEPVADQAQQREDRKRLQDEQQGSAEDRLEVWIPLEEAAEATGLSQAVLEYWDVTEKVESRAVPSTNGGRKEVLLADVMRELQTALERHKTEGEEDLPQLGLHSENEMLRHEIELLRNERDLVERRADLAQAIADERQGRIEDAEREIKRVHTERDELLDEIERMRTEAQQLTEDLRQAVSLCEELTAELDQLRTDRDQFVEELELARRDRQELGAELERSRAAAVDLASELDQRGAEQGRTLRRAEEAEAVAAGLQRGLEEIKRVADLFVGAAEEEEA
jgi:chromosome segregation ATPase